MLLTKVPVCQLQAVPQADPIDERMKSRERDKNKVTKQNSSRNTGDSISNMMALPGAVFPAELENEESGRS